MTKRLVVAALAAAVLAAVPGPARAGKLYAVSAQYEPSNAALYRYEVTGPDDHRYEGNPDGEVDEPELVLPIGQWPDNSPAALALSPWQEMFVFDRGPGGNGGAAGSVFRFLDPAGAAPVPNGQIVSNTAFSFATPHWGAFRGDELFLAQRYGVVDRFLVRPGGPATYVGQIPVSSWDSPRGVQITPWGEVLVAQLGYPPILRYQIAADGAAVPNGEISQCGVSNPHDMVFAPWGELFVASGATSSVVRITFDANRNPICNGAITDGRLYAGIGISVAPWGEVFVSNHQSNEITRWLVTPDGGATFNGTIFTPVGPVVSWVGTVRGLGDVEFISTQERETVTFFSGDRSSTYVDANGWERDGAVPCTHRTSYPLWGAQGDWVTEPAYLIPTYYPYWDVFPGTSWINWYPSYGSPGMSYDYPENYAAYEASFDLPGNAMATSLYLQYMGDDWVDVYLNGVQIVDQHSLATGLVAYPPGFCGYHCSGAGLPNPAIEVRDPALFVPGRNTLRFVQRDPDGAGGLDYLGTVSFARAPDLVPPTIAISAPVAGGAYVLRQPVLAAWSATDAGSGLASASGTVASGAPLDTATVGPKPFTVTATDAAGNSASASAGYTVLYAFGGFLPPVAANGSSSFKIGTGVGVRFQLFDFAKAVVPAAVARLFIARVVNGVVGAESPAATQSGTNQFKLDPATGQYVLNWKTSGLAAGTWRLRIQLDDGTSKTVDVKLTK